MRGVPTKGTPRLTFYLKAVFAFRADDKVLTLCLRQAQNRFASLTFTVDVSFSVTKFVSSKLEESAEFIVFTTSFRYISRHHS